MTRTSKMILIIQHSFWTQWLYSWTHLVYHASMPKSSKSSKSSSFNIMTRTSEMNLIIQHSFWTWCFERIFKRVYSMLAWKELFKEYASLPNSFQIFCFMIFQYHDKNFKMVLIIQHSFWTLLLYSWTHLVCQRAFKSSTSSSLNIMTITSKMFWLFSILSEHFDYIHERIL